MGRVIYAARAIEAATQRFDAAACEVLGINDTDNRCLSIIDNEGGGSITAGRLAELSGLTTAAITALLDRLERKGYVRRVRDERDRRRVLVELTPLMRQRAEPIWGPLAEEGMERLSTFTVDQLRDIERFLIATVEINDQHTERVRAMSKASEQPPRRGSATA